MTERHLPSLWRVAVVAVAVLVVFEALIGLRADRLDPPQDYYAGMARSRVAAAQILSEAGAENDILFVGTSMVRRGVDVAVIERELEGVGQVRNAAIPAAQTPVIKRWLLEEMVPRVQPARVVWGVSSLDFNGNRQLPTIVRYESARATGSGWMKAVDRVLGRMLQVSHHRESLRDPASIGALFGPVAESGDEEEVAPVLDQLLSPGNNWTEALDDIDKEAGRVKTEVLVDWVIGDREASDFRATLLGLLDLGIDVVVVLMPVPERYLAAHPNGAADYEAFERFITAELDGLGVPYLDYSDRFSDDAFRDLTHLLGAPAEQFSALLAADLMALGW